MPAARPEQYCRYCLAVLPRLALWAPGLLTLSLSGHTRTRLARRFAQRTSGGGVALEERVLGLGVERRGRLVEDEEEWPIAHEGAGQRELLPLAKAHLDAAGPRWAELRIETAAESGDDVVGAGAADSG